MTEASGGVACASDVHGLVGPIDCPRQKCTHSLPEENTLATNPGKKKKRAKKVGNAVAPTYIQ